MEVQIYTEEGFFLISHWWTLSGVNMPPLPPPPLSPWWRACRQKEDIAQRTNVIKQRWIIISHLAIMMTMLWRISKKNKNINRWKKTRRKKRNENRSKIKNLGKRNKTNMNDDVDAVENKNNKEHKQRQEKEEREEITRTKTRARWRRWEKEQDQQERWWCCEEQE